VKSAATETSGKTSGAGGLGSNLRLSLATAAGAPDLSETSTVDVLKAEPRLRPFSCAIGANA
jgi:hypothetical protein